MLKFNNVEMLKSMWKMSKTPAAGICLLCQKFFTKTLDKANRNIYNTEKGDEKNGKNNICGNKNKKRENKRTL